MSESTKPIIVLFKTKVVKTYKVYKSTAQTNGFRKYCDFMSTVQKKARKYKDCKSNIQKKEFRKDRACNSDVQKKS